MSAASDSDFEAPSGQDESDHEVELVNDDDDASATSADSQASATP